MGALSESTRNAAPHKILPEGKPKPDQPRRLIALHDDRCSEVANLVIRLKKKSSDEAPKPPPFMNLLKVALA